MKNVINLYYFCIYFKKRPKNDLLLFRFVLYTPQGLKTYQSCRRSFQVNSFRVLADSGSSMGLKNSDFKSGLDVKSGVVKLSRFNITKACKNLGPKKHSC